MPTGYRCPICGGTGLVPNGFYSQIGNYKHGLSASASPETCRSCKGTGVVWSLDADEYPVLDKVWNNAEDAKTFDSGVTIYRLCEWCKEVLVDTLSTNECEHCGWLLCRDCRINDHECGNHSDPEHLECKEDDSDADS